MRWRHNVGQFTAALCLMAICTGIVAAQQPTPLSPAPAIVGEDVGILKTFEERWSKQAKTLKVSGAVVDSTGKAVPNAKLTVLVEWGMRLTGVADAEGKFRLELLGMPSIYIESEDGKLAGMNEPARANGNGEVIQNVTLYPTREVKFVVRNSKGETVAAANCGACINNCIIARAAADAEGAVTLRVPAVLPAAAGDPRNRTATFYAFASERGMAVEAAPLVGGSPAFPTELRLIPPKPYRVHVIDRDKKPLAGLPVTIANYQAMIVSARSSAPGGFGGSTAFSNALVPLSQDLRSYSKSDASGVATFDWLAPTQLPESVGRATFGRQQPRPIAFCALHAEWGMGFGSFDTASDKTDADCIVYSPAKIHGRIRLPNGEPATGILLQSPIGGKESKSVTTNDKGEFDFVALLNDSDLVVRDDKWVADPIGLAALVQKSAESEIELKLREGKRVKFYVTGGTEYAPLANHEIQIIGRNSTRSAHTNAMGRAAVTLDRGLYSIYGNIGEPLSRAGASEIRLLVKDQAEIEVPIHLERAKPRTINVTVLKSDGVTPAANAKVEILNPYTETTSADRFGGSSGMFSSRASGSLEGGSSAGRGGFAPSGPGGFGGGGRGGGDLPLGADGLPIRQVTVQAATTDAAGKTKALVAHDAPALFLVSGAEDERVLTSVDVLDDACTIRLAKVVSAKGKLLDEATGAPISGKEIAVIINTLQVSPDFRRSVRGTVSTGPGTLRSTAVTDAEGNFVFKDLIADAPYTMMSSNTRTPGASGPGESRILISQPNNQGFQSAKAGVKDVGDIKVRQVAAPTPPRPRIPNDPNLQ